MFRLEARTSTPAWFNLALPLLAIGATLLLCSGLIALAGAGVIEAYGVMFSASLGDSYAITETLVRAAPMIFTGLAVAVAFRAKFWNIGAEGQLLAGAVASCAVGAIPMPGPLAMLLMALAGAAAGAAVALVPAMLRVKFKVDDVVSSLLLNSVIYYALMALIEGPWKDRFSGYPISPPIEDSANFPVLIEGTRLHLGVLAALVAAPVIWFLIARTTLGFRISVTGENPEAARYGGINVERVHGLDRAALRCARRPGRRRRGRRRAFPGDERHLAGLRLFAASSSPCWRGSTRSAWCRRRSSSPPS